MTIIVPDDVPIHVQLYISSIQSLSLETQVLALLMGNLLPLMLQLPTPPDNNKIFTVINAISMSTLIVFVYVLVVLFVIVFAFVFLFVKCIGNPKTTFLVFLL